MLIVNVYCWIFSIQCRVICLSLLDSVYACLMLNTCSYLTLKLKRNDLTVLPIHTIINQDVSVKSFDLLGFRTLVFIDPRKANQNNSMAMVNVTNQSKNKRLFIFFHMNLLKIAKNGPRTHSLLFGLPMHHCLTNRLKPHEIQQETNH